MILLKTLYDEFIVRRKMTDQKNPVKHIVTPAIERVGAKNNLAEGIGFAYVFLFKKNISKLIKIKHLSCHY